MHALFHSMLRSGILNPQVAALLCRFRHTNTLVIADRGFPFWPEVETVDLSLTDDIPRVQDVLRLVAASCRIGRSWMAEEFCGANSLSGLSSFQALLPDSIIMLEPHSVFKRRVPEAVGLIRTGDTTQFANLILESA